MTPLMTTLQTNCSKIRSLIINYSSDPDYALRELIHHIQNFLPNISSVTMTDHDEVEIPIGHIGAMFDFKNLKKIVLDVDECPFDGEGKKAKFVQREKHMYCCATIVLFCLNGCLPKGWKKVCH